jgi:excisionase family DNA binding protein
MHHESRMMLNIPDHKLVYSIEEAGAMLGLGRNSAYAAARRGEIPIIRIGRLLKVPKAELDKMLALATSTIEPVVRAKKILKEQKVTVGTSIGIELNNKLVEAAETNGVSLSSEIADRLKRSFRDNAP